MEIAVAVLAIVRVTTSVGLQARKLREVWHDAPRDVYHLCDELETAKSFFDTLQTGIIDSPLTDDPSRAVMRQELTALLLRANSILTGLEVVLAKLVAGGNDSAAPPDVGGRSRAVFTLATTRKLLWLRRLNKMSKLRGMLRSTMDDIGKYLVLLNIQVSMTVMNEARVRGRLAPGTVIQQITDMNQSDKEDPAESEPAVEQSKLNVEDTLLAVAAKVDRLERDPVEVRREAIIDKLPKPGTVNDMNDPWSRALSHTVNRFPMASSLCSHNCRCRCHSTRSPSYTRWEFSGLQHALGSISITFLGLPGSTRCTDTKCRDSQRSAYKIRYSFPRWLARAVISAFFSWYPDTPELLIRVHHVLSPGNVSYEQSIFGRIVNRDNDGLKAAIISRPSSVSDLWPGSRGLDLYESPLHRAVDYQNVTTVRILMQAGADPRQEDALGETPVWRAFKRFVVAGTAEAGQIIAEMASMSTLCDEADFTDLHRVLLGILPISVETALANSCMRAQINDKDSVMQTTPLHIAALRGTVDDVQSLIAAGADVNAVNRNGYPPLYWACSGGREDVAALLLRAGASVHFSTAEGWGLLHVACCLRYRPGLVDLLLEHGVDIDAVNKAGDTALAIATQNPDESPLKPLRHLIARGAKMDTRDRDGHTPLFNAVHYGSCEVAEALLASGADHRTVNNAGESILHVLARFGSCEMMRLFTQTKLRGLDGDMRDAEGKTPFEALHCRADYGQELEVAFQQLLDSLEDRITPDDTGESDVDDDEVEYFHDALEEMAS